MQVQNLFPNSGSNGSNKDGKYTFAPKANLHLTLKTKRTSAYLMEFDRSSQVFRQDVFAGFFFFFPNGGNSIHTPFTPEF